MKLAEITTAEARAELQKINRGTLRAVHNISGIDYNKPHKIIKLYPPFTRQTIRKAAAAAGYPGAAALVLMYDAAPRWKWNENRFTVFNIDAGAGLETTNAMHHTSNPGNALDNAYTKGEFDEIRKRPSSAAYIVLQNDEDHTPRKEAENAPDPWTRYTAARRHCNYYNHVIFDLKPIKGQGTPATVSTWIKSNEKPETPLDAGGYYNADKINDRRRRAEALKAGREKAAYILQDTAADVETVTAAANNLRRHVAGLLLDEDLKRAAVAASAVNIYGFTFSEALQDAKRFQEKSAGHEYRSSSHAARALQNVLDEINKAREKIDGYFTEKTAAAAAGKED